MVMGYAEKGKVRFLSEGLRKFEMEKDIFQQIGEEVNGYNTACHGQSDLEPKHLISSHDSPAALALPVTGEESPPPPSHPCHILKRLCRKS